MSLVHGGKQPALFLFIKRNRDKCREKFYRSTSKDMYRTDNWKRKKSYKRKLCYMYRGRAVKTVHQEKSR